MGKFSWRKLPKPFCVLAPMEGVTDTVFRQRMAEMGKPDVFFTEFTSVDGLFSRGFEYVADRLIYKDIERVPRIEKAHCQAEENTRERGAHLGHHRRRTQTDKTSLPG